MFSLSGLQVLRWHNSYSGSPLKRGGFHQCNGMAKRTVAMNAIASVLRAVPPISVPPLHAQPPKG